MEDRAERMQRESKHFKKKLKKSAHGRNKMRRELEQEEEIDLKRKLRLKEFDEEDDYWEDER